ncbi:unnamed protein product [Notodromas monacha]|uniref:Septin-7 n=1 Tax=Notodromas monacha TaxID=399045 RepID=A0A7R9GGB4_9CRUS|nr:unnamed protein product [Notodromas monacha]CAG0920199.1 unnamed protein product [Notodromas monacha]
MHLVVTTGIVIVCVTRSTEEYTHRLPTGAVNHCSTPDEPVGPQSLTSPVAANGGPQSVQVAKEALRQHLQSKPTSGPVDAGLLPKTSPPPPSILKKDSAYTKENNKENVDHKLGKSASGGAAGGGGHGVRPEQQPPQQKPRKVDGFVGFANLPDQVYRKAVKRGFEFTLMVVGASGLGKSTLINSMFLADVYSKDHPGPSQRIKKTVQVETTKVLLKEKGVNLTLTVVDTPGFGDAVDNSDCWQPIIDYIDARYEEFLVNESRVDRKCVPDSRVHCCLYFVAPGHGLKPLDIEFMKRLHEKVNVIPVVGKADTMTPEECDEFKAQVLTEIRQHKIKIYDFPDSDDEEESKIQRPLKDRVPFAIVGSNTVLEVDGKKVRGRRYPWGTVDVENLEHCDFVALRKMVVRSHMMDLREVTNNVHYENYRCRKLAGVDSKSDDPIMLKSNKNPLAQMEEERKEHEVKMKQMEQDMEQVFEMKVREKKQKMKNSELELKNKNEHMRSNIEQQERELKERRKAFENEVLQWEQSYGITMEDVRRLSLESNSKETMEKKKKKGLF